MAWERYGAKDYYYRSVRRAGGGVGKVYYGAGQAGRIAAGIDALYRAEAEAAQKDTRRERSVLADAMSVIHALNRWCNLVASAALFASGYHRCRRHGWRRWRAAQRFIEQPLVFDIGGPNNETRPTLNESSRQTTEPAVGDDLRALVEQAQGNDPMQLWRIPPLLSDSPEIRDYATYSATIVERVWRAVMGAAETVGVERLESIVAQMHADLVGYRPTRLVQMLADQVIANWRQVRYLERVAAQQSSFGLMCSNHIVVAHRAYEAADRQLKDVRELVIAPPLDEDIHVFDPEPPAKPLGDSACRGCFDEL